MLRTTPKASLALSLTLALLSPALQGSQSAELPTLGVHLKLEHGPDLRLGVQVTVAGDQDGETLMAVAKDWGGVPTDRIDLVDASAQDAQGKTLHVERDSNVQWTVYHEAGATFTLTTWLLPTDLRTSGDSADHYRPLLEPELFQGMGHLLVPSPAVDEDEDQMVALFLSFSGFQEAGWDVAHSYGLGSKLVHVQETRSRISGILFTAGKLQVGTREIRGGQIALVLDRHPWKFQAEEFTELAAEIVNLEREAMDDDGSPFYLVSAIRVGQPSANSYSIGGTGLTNSFALFMQGNTTIAADSVMGPQVRKLLSHECFHEWNGTRIRLVYPGVEHSWFSEGFTEYFARRWLFEDELLDGALYLEWINQSLKEYHNSPVRNMPAQELAEIFWTDMAGQKQPYLRGELVAMLAEHGIRKHTGGSKSLADFMRSLLRESKANPSLRFDTESLLQRLAEFTGPELIGALRSICVDGATVVLPPDVLGDRFVLEESVAHAFEAGFDTTASLPARRVIGLVEGSAAHQAGLQEGDQILGLSVEHGRSEVPVSITVRSTPEAAPRKLSYLPRGEEKRVQQIRAAKD